MTFFNIFSKKESKEKKIRITADHREKNSLVIAELMKLKCEISFEQLGIADYLVNGIAIERKTVPDLKASIINKRIIKQLIEIKKYEKNILLIEGIGNAMYEGIIHPNALRGFVWAVALDYAVPLIYTINEEDTAKYLCLLATRKGDKNSSLRHAPTPMSDEKRLQFIIEGFPGIGPVSAKRLLKKFKTLKGVLEAPAELLEETIGKKAHELIRLRKKEYLLPE